MEVLIDASGSQQGRQALVALQGYIISEALSIVKIPQRVMGFCTFGDFTIMQRFRDYEDDRACLLYTSSFTLHYRETVTLRLTVRAMNLTVMWLLS